MKQLILSIIVFLISVTLRAEVNMRDGSYIKTITDIEIKTHKGIYLFKRLYNSRSLYQGHFGKGWCSDIDKAIDPSNKERLLLADCSIGKRTPYLKEFSTEQVRQGVPSRHPQLETVFYIQPTSGEKLVFQNKEYIKYSINGSVTKFYESGKLKSYSLVNGVEVELEYRNEKLVGLILDNKKIMIESGLVVTSLQFDGQILDYVYRDRLLVSVSKNHKKIQKYEYDQYQNMTYNERDPKDYEFIGYNNGKDLVVSIQYSNQCLEEISYIPISETDYKTILKKTCGRDSEYMAYSFMHKYRSDGSLFLEMMRVEGTRMKFEVVYHPQLGYPISVTQK